jgi:hypothetical protein
MAPSPIMSTASNNQERKLKISVASREEPSILKEEFLYV